MTKVIIADLDPILFKKLEKQAVLRGRSLQAELKYILESAVLSPSQVLANRPLVPLKDLQQSVKKSLRDSGYDSRDKILELVQEVKREIADEREQLKSQ
jgi:plasmid stability protein